MVSSISSLLAALHSAHCWADIIYIYSNLANFELIQSSYQNLYMLNYYPLSSICSICCIIGISFTALTFLLNWIEHKQNQSLRASWHGSETIIEMRFFKHEIAIEPIIDMYVEPSHLSSLILYPRDRKNNPSLPTLWHACLILNYM